MLDSVPVLGIEKSLKKNEEIKAEIDNGVVIQPTTFW